MTNAPITQDDKPAYFTFRITDNNRRTLLSITDTHGSSLFTKARKYTNQYSALSPSDFLDQVYVKFSPNRNCSDQVLEQMTLRINETYTRLRTYFEGYTGPSSIYLMSIMELLKSVMTNLKNINSNIQRLVILNLTNEIIGRCREVIDYYKPHAYLEQPSLEVCELEIYLTSYCDDRRILQDINKRKVDDVIRFDEDKVKNK